jgi:hypothetical protein
MADHVRVTAPVISDRELFRHVLATMTDHLGEVSYALGGARDALASASERADLTVELRDDVNAAMSELTIIMARMGDLHLTVAAAAQTLVARAIAEERLDRRN